MNFETVLKTHFPEAMEEAAFVTQSLSQLKPHQFTAENSLPCVSVCRDELTRSLVDHIQAAWGEAFNFSSLAGMIFAGRTGMGAALAHAPFDQTDGRERYVFFVMPHIGIDEDGTIGKCTRHGRPEKSSACGALVAFQKELSAGDVKLEFDPADAEQSMLKSRLTKNICINKPDLLNITHLTHDAIVEDLEQLIDQMIDTGRADYAVFSGIQIHGPNQTQFVAPVKSYAVVKGERTELNLSNQLLA